MTAALDEMNVRRIIRLENENRRLQMRAERSELLLAQSTHRLRNTLSVVQFLAIQTARHAAPETFSVAFDERLQALARSHDLLALGQFAGTELRDIIEQTLAPYQGSCGGITLEGPSVMLKPDGIVTICLAFQELATNAVKYGGLSTPDGCIDVAWSTRQTDRGVQTVDVVWLERLGPPVTPPRHRGFGLRLLEAGLAHEFGGTIVLDFAPTGLDCRISLPSVSKLIDPERDGAHEWPRR